MEGKVIDLGPVDSGKMASGKAALPGIVDLGPVRPQAGHIFGVTPQSLQQARGMGVPDLIAFTNPQGLSEKHEETQRRAQLENALQHITGNPNRTFMELTAGDQNVGTFLRAAKPDFSFKRLGGAFVEGVKGSMRGKAMANVAAERKWDVLRSDDRRRWELSLTGMERAEYRKLVKEGLDAGESLEQAEQKAMSVRLGYHADYWEGVAQGTFRGDPNYQQSSGWVEDLASVLGGSSVDMLIQAANAPMGAVSMFQTIMGGKYDELKGKGYSDEDARRGAIADAIGESPIEFLGNMIDFAAAKAGFKGGSVGKKLLDFSLAAGGDAAEELLQSIPSAFGDFIAANPDASVMDVLNQFAPQIPAILSDPQNLYSASLGAGMGGGFYAVGHVAGYPARRAERVALERQEAFELEKQRAVATYAYWMNLIEKSDGLDMKQHRELFQEYLGSGHIKDLPEQAYLTPEGVAELEEAGLLEELGVDTEEAVREADLGRDVKISVSKILSVVNGETAESVAKHLKLSTESISVAQAQRMDPEASFKNTRDFWEDRERRTSVSSHVRQELIARYLNAKTDADLAEADAQTAPLFAFAEKVGPLVGMTPDEYVANRLVGIVDENTDVQGMAEAAQELEQAAMYRSPRDMSDFIDNVYSGGQKSKAYKELGSTLQAFPDAEVQLPSDIVIHDIKRHPDLTKEDWLLLDQAVAGMSGRNIVESTKKPRFSGVPMAGMVEVDGQTYGVGFEKLNDERVVVTTLFKGSKKAVREWQKKDELKRLRARRLPQAAQAPKTGTNSQAVSTPTDSIIDGSEKAVNAGLSETVHTYHDGKRGSISTLANGRHVIKLFGEANKSTLLHESGHFFYLEYERLVDEGLAPEWMMRDYEELRQWSGLDKAKSEEEQVAAHEKIARGFEAYLRTGKSPSLKLQRYFSMFKRWLTAIYRSVKELNVKLTPAVRETFDRMLATDEQIAETRHVEEESRRPFVELADVIPGISEDELRMVRELEAEADAEAYALLDAELNRDRQKRLKEWTRDAVDVWQETRIGQFLSSGGTVGIETMKTDFDSSTVKEILRRRPGKVVNGGLPYDMAATQYGYEDGEQLVLDLLEGPTKGEFIDRFIEEREAEHDKIVREDSVGESEAYARFLELQAKLLARKMPDYKPVTREELKEKASGRVDGMTREEVKDFAVRTKKTIRDLEREVSRIRRGLSEAVLAKDAAVIARQAEADVLRSELATAEAEGRVAVRDEARRADEAESRAVLNDSIVVAIERERANLYGAVEKQRQLHADYKAAQKAKQEQQKVVRYLKRVGKTARNGKSMTAEANELIQDILAKLDLRNISNKEMERLDDLRAWAYAKELEGVPFILPERTMALLGRVHFKQMSLEELREVSDTVRAIEHRGRADQKAIVGDERRAFKETRDAMVEAVYQDSDLDVQEKLIDDDEMNWGNYREWFDKERVKKDLSGKMRGFFSTLIKVEILCDRLDGGKRGVWTKAVFEPISDAVNRAALRKSAAVEALQIIFDKHYTKKEMRAFGERVRINKKVGFLDKEHILAVALNRCNGYNLKAVMEGRGWNDQDMLDIWKHVDDRDWAFAQDVWDHLESEYWGDVVELYRRVAGNAPEKVKPTPFETSTGMKMRGGYYPVAFDGDGIKAAKRIETENVNEQFGLAMSTYTKNGHTKARTGSGGQPVDLHLSVLYRHLADVITDLEMREAVISVNRLLNSPHVIEIIGRTLGKSAHVKMRKWLAASVGNMQENGLEGYSLLLRLLRKFRTFAAMGFKVTTFLSQGAGLFNSAGIVGTRNIAQAVTEVMANPKEVYGFIYENSHYMLDRKNNFDREVYDENKRMGMNNVPNEIVKAGFWHIQQADFLISSITWKAAYDKAVRDGMPHKDAIAEGDRAVRISQGSGRATDLAEIQRGGEIQKQFTMFYSFFSAQFNQFYKMHYDYRRTGNKAELMARTWWLWFGPAIVSELLIGGGADDDEDWGTWAVKTVAVYPFMTLPFVREAASVISTDFGPQGSLPGELAYGIKGFAKEVSDDDGDTAAAVKKGLRLVNSQAEITIGQFVEYLTGDKRHYSPRDVFLRDKE